jgi:hypothetical protein
MLGLSLSIKQNLSILFAEEAERMHEAVRSANLQNASAYADDGALHRIRTDDLILTMDALYRLS